MHSATRRTTYRDRKAEERRAAIEAEADRRRLARELSLSRERPGMGWYALFTNPMRERSVEVRAIEAGFCAYVPEGSIWTKPQRSTDYVRRERCALPRYVFVAEPNGRPVDWFFLRRIDGVHGALGNEGRPLMLRPGAISLLRAMEAAGEFNFNKDPSAPPPPVATYVRGDKITIKSGPLAGFTGPAVAASDRHGVDIEVLLFGRATITRVPLDFIAEAA
ncbi:hypothetical protein GCM10008171_32780 [Methylopila jiangsuensis]|uniref:NusG-like N-terminal domain-containing protein n=1 Tax=Methylopila jiangsuensis TaxID=586230 RepID=A0A9W6N4D6_9HYPH|nr:transcription termination/antitermination NusG family protein [Methylopila jiangsuensis]MDR6284587.1 transcription antitermination factor NusG [Methylopila jiangsuensis]GLK78024.1 hypothetical protein GCM10008171_32780 [Methylopila jiangsuensis]